MENNTLLTAPMDTTFLDSVLNALRDPIRRWILIAVAENDLCAVDLQHPLGSSAVTLCRHISVLRSAQLVTVQEGHRKPLSLSEWITISRQNTWVTITIRTTRGDVNTLRLRLLPGAARSFDALRRACREHIE